MAKYTKPIYIHITVDANPKPTPKLLKQWADLDKFAKHEFNKPYDSLKRVEALQLHVNIKEGKYKNLDVKQTVQVPN